MNALRMKAAFASRTNGEWKDRWDLLAYARRRGGRRTTSSLQHVFLFSRIEWRHDSTASYMARLLLVWTSAAMHEFYLPGDCHPARYSLRYVFALGPRRDVLVLFFSLLRRNNTSCSSLQLTTLCFAPWGERKWESGFLNLVTASNLPSQPSRSTTLHDDRYTSVILRGISTTSFGSPVGLRVTNVQSSYRVACEMASVITTRGKCNPPKSQHTEHRLNIPRGDNFLRLTLGKGPVAHGK